MADTNLLILAREFKNLRTKVQEILKMPVGPQGLQGEKGEQGVKGDIGAPGKNGKDGKDGSKGLDGLNGKDGTDGIDGKDGVDGVSVVDARVDFDGSLVLTLSNGTEIDAGKVSSEQVENVYAMLKNGAASLNELLPAQEGNANKYLKTDGVNTSWDTLDGSDINLASPPVIGNVTPNAGTFTEVAVTTATGESAFNENDTITGWLYSGNTFSTIGQESNPVGLFIGSAGTKMYVNGTTGDDVNEYTLGTAWDITTATFVTTFSTSAQDSAPNDIFFKPDGLSMFIMGGNSDFVSQYTLGTAWSIATASYASKAFSVNAQEATPTGVWFKPDGTEMYVVGTSTDSVFQYALSTAWDVSTASYGGIFYSFVAQETSASQVNLSDDGLKMWVLGQTGDDIWEYNLATAWDVSTATPVNNFYVGFQETSPSGLFIDSTAPNRVYMVGNGTDAVYQYNTENNAVKLDTEKLYVDGALTVNNNFVAGANAYVDGTLAVQGGVTAGGSTFSGLTATGTLSLSSSTTSTTSLGTSQTSGTLFIGGTSGTGIMTIGQSTVSQTTNIQAGATASGSTKAINIGTAGLSGSTTNINIGSAVSGSLGTTTISAPTVNISTGANGVNISNGGTVTALTRTSSGGGYTSIPAIAISAPTTAGGVQAAANANVFVQAVSIASGGTGYTVGNTLTLVGGTFTAAATLTVSTVSAGVITGVTVASGGTAYTAIPTNPVSVTGGTGSGATFNVTAWGVAPTFTITNAGSGYVEQPTVTFSGGGGSGAAAYARVGGNTSIRSLGTSIDFQTPGGTGFRVSDTGSTGVSFWQALTGSSAILRSNSGNALLQTSDSNGLFLQTNGGVTQAVVSHTASAVNYVQVTGAATGVPPVISAQGSDTNIHLTLQSKGSNGIRLSTAGASTIQAFVSHTASAVNFLQLTGAAAGASPVFSVAGTDTNIDLALTPKGTGNVRFGTYTASMALTVQGYIEIKDSGGTVRKLAVIA
jgi:hypothetical protein